MPQIPSVAPAALLQAPPQHSRSCEHASPACVQNDTCALHKPFWHKAEQHSEFPAHALPDVLHDGLSGAHVPPLQLELQHCVDVEQACPSAVHAVALHAPPSHTN